MNLLRQPPLHFARSSLDDAGILFWATSRETGVASAMTTKPDQSAPAKATTGGGAAPKEGVNRGNAGKGRPKGSPNKENKMLREMILQALDRNGGVDYLADQAIQNPKAFLSLLGRVLPMQVTGEGGGAIDHSITVTFK